MASGNLSVRLPNLELQVPSAAMPEKTTNQDQCLEGFRSFRSLFFSRGSLKLFAQVLLLPLKRLTLTISGAINSILTLAKRSS